MTRAIQKIERQCADWLVCLPAGELTKALLYEAWRAILEQSPERSLADRLRILRQMAFRRLYQLDCEQAAPLEVVMRAMTDLAEFCIGTVMQSTHAESLIQYGLPMGVSGRPSQIWPVGMGKLGARELNVSSDIDLIFVYDEDGETAGGSKGKIANHEFFAKQVRMVQSLLSDVTGFGFVFRVDLALRPYGREGALAGSLHSLAQYFQRVGREWERFAWLKSRVIAISPDDKPPLALRSVVRSFVFRRFLDHKVFVALRGLHQLIRKNVQDVRDVKLGRGGIREIEFAAQVLQIVRGGRQPELLTRPTLSALKRLTAAGLMGETSAQQLAEAYDFLRRTEHRIQYLDDQQTHILPRSAQDLAWVASSMGFDSQEPFEAELAIRREQVAGIFEEWVNRGIAPPVPTVTIDMLEAKAKWVTKFVRKHPDVVDELLRPEALTKGFDSVVFKRSVTAQYESLQATGLCDEEAILDLLRRAHQTQVFRILVRDVQGLLSVRDVGDELSALADAMLALALPWCAAYIRKQWPAGHTGYGLQADLSSHFSVIAYGKLGGKELGYGSDLDVVFLYDDDNDSASQYYTALVRKLISWLTVKTGEGDLYEIDTALRPNGNSGLLVTSIASYEKYQLQRGSNTAWTWELQAMTRARCVFGGEALRTRFDAIRAKVLTTPRDPTLLRQEIAAMREKLRAAYPAQAGTFDIKHSAGGMLDVEFAVQCLVLTHAKDCPDLIGNVGNIELLKIAQANHLLADDTGILAANAYQLLRDAQHAARLQQVKAQLPADQMLAERAVITGLWQQVFIPPSGDLLRPSPPRHP
jgi:glutamine synthetase adenylyltransferase